MSTSIYRIQGEEELSKGEYFEVDLSLPPIGKGGMGSVYRGVRVVEKTGLRQEVAVKFMYDGLPNSAYVRAEREASIRLKNDNLVEMIAFVKLLQKDAHGNPVTRVHIVSELLVGVMLKDLLYGKTQDAFGMEVPYAQELLELRNSNRSKFAATIVKKVVSGLMALHDAGYIHRDIDPSNIMITRDGKVKLIDFGIATTMQSLANAPKVTIAGNFVGKPEYSSPEQCLGDLPHMNATSDIYSVGILLYQLVTGDLPFNGPVNEVREMQCKALMPLENIDKHSLRAIIEKSTYKEQQRRFQTAAELRVAIEKIAPTLEPGYIDWEEESDDESIPSSPVKIFVAVGLIGLVVGAVVRLLFS